MRNFEGDRLTTNGSLDVQGFRYRNLPIGDTAAAWSSRRNDIVGTLAVGGKEGRLRAGGSIGLARAPDLPTTFLRSRYDLSAAVSDLDLSLWVRRWAFRACRLPDEPPAVRPCVGVSRS